MGGMMTGGAGMGAMMLWSPVAIFGLLAAAGGAVAWALHAGGHHPDTRTPEPPRQGDAIRILERRYAQGLIDDTEFARRMEVLTAE